MQNKIVAFSLIGSVVIAILGAIIEGSNAPVADVFYTIGGLGLFTFGIWASVLLLKE